MNPIVDENDREPDEEGLPTSPLTGGAYGSSVVKPMTVNVSAFPEGPFARVEVMLRVDVDLMTTGKLDRTKRAALEVAVERALRAMAIELAKEEW